MIQLSPEHAAHLMVHSLGLASPPTRPATREDVLDCIRQMGALQIDTIHVVARSPYLVLFARLGAFEPVWLEELLASGALFEYWSHAACFLPIEDWPLYRRSMLGHRRGIASSREWLEQHRDAADAMLAHIRARGPVMARDFERTDGKAGGWWEWKHEKLVLEHLHTTGELMITARRSFQRVYELRERVLPTWRDEDAPTWDQVRTIWAERALRALGISNAAWLRDYFRTAVQGSQGLLEHLEGEGRAVRAEVAGWPGPWWVHTEHLPLLARLTRGEEAPTTTCLLSPFDPLVWHRSRALQVMGFDYRIECYTPAPKRRYGYFCLPILHRGRLIGRLDPKAHRSQGVMEIKALHLEPGVALTEVDIQDLRGALRRFAQWHNTPRLQITRAPTQALARALEG